ncbi:zinc dependent phospholipase C family protein [Virgibacillus senegalensis]|uniref:zinc dependent phospholipase C family protein n=1 Tax=Virgibacillus senegalensis TaxID=1499679 RepID=UPI00069FAEFD|nr:zinc dependent phospholipase C family protein [Virgibacillus senegalensis]
MPNSWTHILFCEEIADSLTLVNPFFQQDAYMKIGAQGPDPFFYHDFWPWKKSSPVNQIGTLLHTEKCGDFLIDLLDEASDKTTAVKAYVFGFTTHHILDRNTHPYIHYKAGYRGSSHQQLEIIIDTLVAEKLRNLKTWKAPVYKELDAGRMLGSEISELMTDLINRHYPNLPDGLTRNYIEASYQDMKRALRLLYDPYGWKNALFPSLVSAFSHRPVTEKTDFLNESGSVWYHPATKEASRESFWQLFERARIEGIEIMNEVIDYWKKPSVVKKQKLRTLIENISYDTGKPLHLNVTNRYSDPIV